MTIEKNTIPIKRKVIYIILAIFLVVLTIELMAWIAYYTVLSKQQRRALKYIQSGQSPHMISQYCIPHPYSLYMLAPSYTGKGIKQHNSLGFRGNELRQEKDLYRIVCMGGSTTYGWGVKENPQWAYPLQMEALLRKHNGKIEVINAGMPMACSAEIFATFQHRVLPLKPKMLILHCGLNDTFPILMPDYKPDYTHDRTPWHSNVLSEYKFRLNFKSFQVFYLLLKYQRIDRFGASYTHPNHRKWRKYYKAHVFEALDPKRYVGFNNNLKSVLAICQINNIKVIISPTTIQAGSDKEFPAFAIVYKKNLEIMKQLQKFSNTSFLDTSHLNIPKIAFSDMCHLGKKGHAIKAKAFAKAILSKLP